MVGEGTLSTLVRVDVNFFLYPHPTLPSPPSPWKSTMDEITNNKNYQFINESVLKIMIDCNTNNCPSYYRNNNINQRKMKTNKSTFKV